MAPAVTLPLEKRSTIHTTEMSTGVIKQDWFNQRISTLPYFGKVKGSIDS